MCKRACQFRLTSISWDPLFSFMRFWRGCKVTDINSCLEVMIKLLYFEYYMRFKQIILVPIQ